MSKDDMDIRRVRRLLRETKRLAEQASLTGSLEKGGKFAVRQYNAIRQHLQDTGVIPEDLFTELDEDEASFDELGVACALLEGYLEEDEQPEDPRHERRAQRHRPRFGMSFSFGDELKELGETIREHLPEMIQIKVAKEVARELRREFGDQIRNDRADAEANRAEAEANRAEAEANQAEATARLHTLIERLKHNDLTEEQRTEIAELLAQLTQGRPTPPEPPMPPHAPHPPHPPAPPTTGFVYHTAPAPPESPTPLTPPTPPASPLV